MASWAQTIIAGHLGRDPETRYLPSGDAVTNFSVAVTESWKKDGEKKEQTTWYRVNAFGKLAEICGQYLKKGSSVLIVGKMQQREWNDKDGNKRESWELRADTMQMLCGNREGHEQRQTGNEQSTPAPSRGFGDMDDDVPF